MPTQVWKDMNAWSYTGQPGWGGSNQGIWLYPPMSQFPTDPKIPGGSTPGPAPARLVAGSAVPRTLVYLQEADSTICTSTSGQMGVLGDSVFSTLSSGHPIVPITGAPTKPLGFQLPDDSWSVTSFAGDDTASYLVLYTDSTVIRYQRFDWQPGEVEEWSYNGGDAYLMVHNPGLSDRMYELQFVADSPDSEVVCRVENITTAPGENTSIAMTVDEEIQLDNYGGSTTFDLRVRIASNNGAFLFYRDSVEIGAATSQRIIPDWRPNGDSLMILIDAGMTGTYDDTLLVENQGPPCLCLYQSDINADNLIDAVDLAVVIDIVFFGAADSQDPACPKTRADFNGDGVTDAVDLAILIDHVFFGGSGPIDPCAP